MTDEATITGGCQCGALRWEARGAPSYAGFCCCEDCRKASGAGFIPFMGFEASRVTITGAATQHRSPSIRGTDAVRNRCAACGGLVFGGEVGRDTSHTIYAGSLDDPAWFRPTIAIFNRDRPAWVEIPAGIRLFETMPD